MKAQAFWQHDPNENPTVISEEKKKKKKNK